METSKKLITHPFAYCDNLNAYKRRETIEVRIGDVPMGAHHPIRVQSMTTVDTMDTMGSVEQIIRMVEAGCEYVRITAPSIKEAQNLAEIKKELRARGYQVPLVADIHFTPNAAEVAARLIEKVRINPGNYVDKKKFELIEYDDAAYLAELEKIRERFVPLVRICKEYGTAMRIGTNHGSLSDRILSRYGDTPLGMVESALEFLRICEEEQYDQVVLSMKASNTQVMVQAYRLLVQKLQDEGMKPYPLHLGVTEAGDGEDGRIKSAVGIGALLEDGLGDTIRVSLTEEPEAEAPVAFQLVDRYTKRAATQQPIPSPIEVAPKDPFRYERRPTQEVLNLGGHQVPRVLADFSRSAHIGMDDLKAVGHFYLPATDKWAMNDQGCDYLYTGMQSVDFMLPNGLKQVADLPLWLQADAQARKHMLPLFRPGQWVERKEQHADCNFVRADIQTLQQEAFLQSVKGRKDIVLLLQTDNSHAMAELRACFFQLWQQGIDCPAIVGRTFPKEMDPEQLQLFSATDLGGLLIDGWGDGVMLSADGPLEAEQQKLYNGIAFGILQAARTRMTKTEYISCPSCGRTLFDLQETTAMIRKRTDHLKGIKIGIMGCIVNGPGEMADADYGYVGSGKDRITLYRGQEVVKRSVHSDQAVDALIELIREDGRWLEPSAEIEA